MDTLAKLNYGSGENKLDGFINMDIEEKTNPDVVCDIRKTTLPLKANTCSEIWMIHSLEHIERRYWNVAFEEFHRVLVPGGRLVLAYPEFDVCAKYYIENRYGIRSFFEATLYGRQLYPGDYHVTPIRSVDLEQYLLSRGFSGFKHGPQPIHDYYTLAECRSCVRVTKEDVLRNEIFV